MTTIEISMKIKFFDIPFENKREANEYQTIEEDEYDYENHIRGN